MHRTYDCKQAAAGSDERGVPARETIAGDPSAAAIGFKGCMSGGCTGMRRTGATRGRTLVSRTN